MITILYPYNPGKCPKCGSRLRFADDRGNDSGAYVYCGTGACGYHMRAYPFYVALPYYEAFNAGCAECRHHEPLSGQCYHKRMTGGCEMMTKEERANYTTIRGYQEMICYWQEAVINYREDFNPEYVAWVERRINALQEVVERLQREGWKGGAV